MKFIYIVQLSYDIHKYGKPILIQNAYADDAKVMFYWNVKVCCVM